MRRRLNISDNIRLSALLDRANEDNLQVNELAWIEDEIDYILKKIYGCENKRTNKAFRRYLRNHCIYSKQKMTEDVFKRVNDLFWNYRSVK